MKPPVEHVKISAKAKETLIKVKRNTGLEHWNEICRIALCKSIANPTIPPNCNKGIDTCLEIEWKTFSGQFDQTFSSMVMLRAYKDGVDTTKKGVISDYFRSHMERGITSLQGTKSLSDLIPY